MSPPLTLASGSPRRRDLLREAGIELVVRTADVDETPRPGEAAGDLVRRLSRAKAEAVGGEGLVVAADTVVVRDGVILGKPGDAAEARAMLASLAGRSHSVITGFAVLAGERSIVDAVETEVVFRPLDPGLIAEYVATGEPMDKAGAYGIQGLAGRFVQRIAGSYSNVVGLPLVEVLDAIAELGGPRR